MDYLVKDSPSLSHHKLGLYLGLIREESKVDLLQCLHDLHQARAAQFTEQGLRACCSCRERPSHQCSFTILPTSAQHPTPWLSLLTVSEEDMGCFVGEGRCPPEVCNQGLNRLGRTDHCWSQTLHPRSTFCWEPLTDAHPLLCDWGGGTHIHTYIDTYMHFDMYTNVHTHTHFDM